MTERLRGRAAVAQRLRRLRRSGGVCERCRDAGRTRLATVVDHIVPLAKGGSDEDGNTRNLCHECHREVTAGQFGQRVAWGARGIDRTGRPTSPDHPWRQAAPPVPVARASELRRPTPAR